MFLSSEYVNPPVFPFLSADMGMWGFISPLPRGRSHSHHSLSAWLLEALPWFARAAVILTFPVTLGLRRRTLRYSSQVSPCQHLAVAAACIHACAPRGIQALPIHDSDSRNEGDASLSHSLEPDVALTPVTFTPHAPAGRSRRLTAFSMTVGRSRNSSSHV